MWRAASSGAHPQDKRFFVDGSNLQSPLSKAQGSDSDNAGAQTAILVSSMSPARLWCEFQSSVASQGLPAFSPTAGFGPKR